MIFWMFSGLFSSCWHNLDWVTTIKRVCFKRLFSSSTPSDKRGSFSHEAWSMTAPSMLTSGHFPQVKMNTLRLFLANASSQIKSTRALATNVNKGTPKSKLLCWFFLVLILYLIHQGKRALQPKPSQSRPRKRSSSITNLPEASTSCPNTFNTTRIRTPNWWSIWTDTAWYSLRRNDNWTPNI